MIVCIAFEGIGVKQWASSCDDSTEIEMIFGRASETEKRKRPFECGTRPDSDERKKWEIFYSNLPIDNTPASCFRNVDV